MNVFISIGYSYSLEKSRIASNHIYSVLRWRLDVEGFSGHSIRLLVLGVYVWLLGFVHDVAHDVALHKLPLAVRHLTD